MEEKKIIRVELELKDEVANITTYDIIPHINYAYETVAMFKGVQMKNGETFSRRIYKNAVNRVVEIANFCDIVKMTDGLVCYIDAFLSDKKDAIALLKNRYNELIEEAHSYVIDFLDKKDELRDVTTNEA